MLDESKSVGSVACDLDLTETALPRMGHRARADRTHGKTGLSTAEREELARLRKEVRVLGEVPIHRDGADAPALSLLCEGFWLMAHESRTDWSIMLGSLFRLIVGALPWVDRRAWGSRR